MLQAEALGLSYENYMYSRIPFGKTVSDLALSLIKKGLPRSINSFNMASVYQVEISMYM